jgi:hypothetical protein
MVLKPASGIFSFLVKILPLPADLVTFSNTNL